jgi:hypothetical protein
LRWFKVNLAQGASRHWIEVIDTSGLFEVPSRPTPRERFTARVEKVDRGPSIWPGTHVDTRCFHPRRSTGWT